MFLVFFVLLFRFHSFLNAKQIIRHMFSVYVHKNKNTLRAELSYWKFSSEYKMREMTTFKYDENAAKTLSNFNQNFILLLFSNSVNFNLSKSMKTPFSFKVRTMRWNLFLFLSEEMVDLSLQFFAFFVWSHYILY